MTHTRDDIAGTALGNLQRGMETAVQVPVYATGPHEGQVDEHLLLQRLQDLALVSQDVRGVYVEPQDDGTWLVLDVDSEDTVAWFALPWGAGV